MAFLLGDKHFSYPNPQETHVPPTRGLSEIKRKLLKTITVFDKNNSKMSECHPARARTLLKAGAVAPTMGAGNFGVRLVRKPASATDTALAPPK
jgi:hypothetical protein